MNNRSTINWWEVNPNSILSISPEGRAKIYSMSKPTQTDLFSKRTIHRWITGERNPIVLNFLEYLEYLGINPEQFTEYIQGFSSFKNPEKSWKINFPLSEHWTHVGIIAHGFFDGNECCRILVYGTTTYEENEMFKELVENSNLNVPLLIYSKDRVGVPASITQLLKNHYNITTFNSLKCSFSQHIMDLAIKKPEFRRVILKAAFIDEGYVLIDRLCAFGIKNDRLRLQLCELLTVEGLEYWCSPTPSEVLVLLKRKSIDRFYDLIIKDMSPQYHKKLKAIKLLEKIKLIRKRKADNENMYFKIAKSISKNSGQMTISDIYRKFNVNVKNKKTFYDKYIRIMIRKGLIKTKRKGDKAWVLGRASGMTEGC